MRIIFCLLCGYRTVGKRIDDKTICPNCWNGHLSFINPGKTTIPNGIERRVSNAKN